MVMFHSKRTAFALVLLATATLLLLVGAIDGAQWTDLARLLATTLLVSHTVSHAVDTAARRPSTQAPVEVPTATARESS